jgi:hypothetical protein
MIHHPKNTNKISEQVFKNLSLLAFFLKKEFSFGIYKTHRQTWPLIDVLSVMHCIQNIAQVALMFTSHETGLHEELFSEQNRAVQL